MAVASHVVLLMHADTHVGIGAKCPPVVTLVQPKLGYISTLSETDPCQV
jgi:hypothetical protein